MQWTEFKGRALSVMLTQDNDLAKLSVEGPFPGRVKKVRLYVNLWHVGDSYRCKQNVEMEMLTRIR